MTINPRDYDPDELRNLDPQGVGPPHRGSGWPSDEPPRPTIGRAGGPTRPDEVLRSNQYRELYLLERSLADGELARPYLEELPGTIVAETVVFEWLEFLVAKAGFKRSLDALRYYRSIGWLSTDVEAQLRDYLAGFDERLGANPDALDRADHTLSLVYVARLAAIATA